METLKHPAYTLGLGSAPLSQMAFPGESNPNFPWEKSHWDNTVVKSIFKKLFVFVWTFSCDLMTCVSPLCDLHLSLAVKCHESADQYPQTACSQWSRLSVVALGNSYAQKRYNVKIFTELSNPILWPF